MVDWGARVREVMDREIPASDEAGETPVVACAPDVGLDAVLADVNVLDLLEAGMPGLVVVDAGRPVGYVPARVLREHLLEYLPDTGTMGPEALDGDLQPPPALTLTCSVCRTSNTVLVYVRGRTLCTQGHTLTLDWA
ncbi:hypothetical protein SSP531S_40470 [Streptomyces spongiicola]|uniref:CBS domain-containing protein n=1 Tax=Streptomyces spongiicola TaxID=1690221 RepID=A0A388T0X5_9ACTN|nr:hypothetical protein [Streptomyces spongiicola]GBQ02588.1 hypothetical protein SSP531S_40470 [Streptomyces spongiicola]